MPISVDGSSVGFLSLPGAPESVPSESQTGWTWSQLVTDSGDPTAFTISSGDHVLQIEGFTGEEELDRIVLSVEPGFTPSDGIPISGDAVSITEQPGSLIEVVEGESLTLQVGAISTGTLNFQWFKDGYLLQNEVSPILSIEETEPVHAGSYTALVSSGGAAEATTPTTVSIVESPFNVSRLTIGEANSVQFEISGKLGTLVSIYGSNDLVNWSLVSVQPNETGTISITDPDAEGQPKRFYRLEAP